MLYRIGLLTRQPIIREGEVFAPAVTEVYASPALRRTFECKVGCIACCSVKITVDFSPEEFASFKWSKKVRAKATDLFSKREIEVNGKQFPIFTYNQFADPACQFLDNVREGGALGCSFYPHQPLECASAPQLSMTTIAGHSVITKRPFGRWQQWTNVPQCIFSPTPVPLSPLMRTKKKKKKAPINDADHELANEIGLLKRYKGFADYFELDTHLDAVIQALRDLPDTLEEAAGLSKDPAIHYLKVIPSPPTWYVLEERSRDHSQEGDPWLSG
jgi:hypothetical protein